MDQAFHNIRVVISLLWLGTLLSGCEQIDKLAAAYTDQTDRINIPFIHLNDLHAHLTPHNERRKSAATGNY